MQNENELQDSENTPQENRVWNCLAFWCPVNFAPTPPLKMDQSGHVPPKKEKNLFLFVIEMYFTLGPMPTYV